MTDTMRALVAAADGLQERRVPVPAPGPAQVRVRVRAAALNNADLAAGDGERVAGWEFSGEVAELGAQTRGWSIGDRVMGTAPAAFAESVLADHRHLLAVPDGLDHDTAAALPTALLTEHGALMRAGFTPGDDVLITAATSGIASIGVQVARHLGAGTVVATTRTAAKRAMLDGLGADRVVVTDDEDLAEAVRDATGGAGAAIVLDHVGGALLPRCLDAAAAGGTVVSVGRTGGDDAGIDLALLAARGLTLHGVSFGFTPPEVIGDLMAALAPDLLPAVADGRIRPVIDAVVPVAQADAALQRLRGGTATGKVVLHLG